MHMLRRKRHCHCMPAHEAASSLCHLLSLQKGPNIAFWCVGPIAAIVWCDLPPAVLTCSTHEPHEGPPQGQQTWCILLVSMASA